MGILILNNQTIEQHTPTVEERLTMTTNEQRDQMLWGWLNNRVPEAIERKYHIWQDVVKLYYEGIDSLQNECLVIMRGQMIQIPGQPATEETEATEDVYFAIPTDKDTLIGMVSDQFAYFGTAIDNIVDTFIKWSNGCGDATFEFYAANIN